MEDLGERWAFSLAWLNEGHMPGHHRDGHAVQLWVKSRPWAGRLSLMAGLGPYRYFDTKMASEGRTYVDSHGWGALVSLAAVWSLTDRWFFHLRSNWVETGRSIDTGSLLFGIGYRMDGSSRGEVLSESERTSRKKRNNEITVFLGRTIVNSNASEESTARSIEYRRRLGRSMDWTVGWLNEGDPKVIRRNGLVTQIWAVSSFFEDCLSLGIGAGPYLAMDERRDAYVEERSETTIAGYVTMTASYHFHEYWLVRLSWNRIVTDYNRDTDVILAGVGCRF